MRSSGNEKIYRGADQNRESVSPENAFVMKLESFKNVTKEKILKKTFYQL